MKGSGASRGRDGDEALWAREEATEDTETLGAEGTGEGGGQLISGEELARSACS